MGQGSWSFFYFFNFLYCCFLLLHFCLIGSIIFNILVYVTICIVSRFYICKALWAALLIMGYVNSTYYYYYWSFIWVLSYYLSTTPILSIFTPDIDECLAEPCANGTCNNLINDFSCNCFEGWDGPICDEYIGCESDPCQNGGSCTQGGWYLICNCVFPYNGTFCEISK